MRNTKILVLALVMFSVIPAMAVAPSGPTIPNLNTNSNYCTQHGGKFSFSAYMTVVNDEDSAVGGTYWAKDFYTKNIYVYQMPGVNNWCTAVVYAQTSPQTSPFRTLTGPSPEHEVPLKGGYYGTYFYGGYIATFTTTRLPAIKNTNRYNLGVIDFKCDGIGNCPGKVNWLASFFSNPDTNTNGFNELQWGWQYVLYCPTSHSYQTWFNTGTGNSGDIVCN